MIHFSTLIQRNQIESLFPKGSYKFLKFLSNFDDESISKKFSDAFSPSDMLLNNEFRDILITWLNEQECLDLLQALEVNSSQNDPWKELKHHFENADCRSLDILFKFLGVETEGLKEIFENLNNISEKLIPKDESPVTTACPERTLFPHQREALLKLESHFFAESTITRRRAMLHMPTGSGKTRTAAMMAVRYLIRFDSGLVIWLADTRELCQQAYEELLTAWRTHGDRPVKIYRAWNQFKLNLNEIKSGILVMSLQTANRRQDNLKILAASEPLVIFDEAHKTTATTYFQTVSTLHPEDSRGNGRLLGLSATPGRSAFDKSENKKLVEAYGGLIVSINFEGYNNPVEYLIKNQYLAKPKTVNVSSNFDIASCCRSLGIDLSRKKSTSYSRLLQALANDKERTALVLTQIKKLIEEGHQRIIVFTCSVEQAKTLAFCLRFNDFWARAIDSSSDPYYRESSIKDFKIPRTQDASVKILCNFNILTTGFDAPETSAVVIARPTNSLVLYCQMVGRALRGLKAGGNEEATVISIVDKNLPDFWNFTDAFKHWDSDWTIHSQ